MKIQELNNLKTIIQYSYDDVDSSGVFLETLWESIQTGNPHLNLKQSFEALIAVLRFLIDKRMVVLVGYDQDKQEEITWDGKGKDEIQNLIDYLAIFSQKKIKENPAFLDQFKYSGFRWKVDWPIDLEKYGIKSA